MPRRQIDAEDALAAVFLVVLLERTADFVGLHTDDRVLLRIEPCAAIIDFNPDQILIELVAVALKGLLDNELEESASLGCVGKLLAFQDPAQLFSFFKEREWDGLCGRFVCGACHESGHATIEPFPMGFYDLDDASTAWRRASIDQHMVIARES